MGKKRKAAAVDDTPAQIDQLACSADGTGPFTVYFPSGFDPSSASGGCDWTAYEHTKGRNHYTLVARTDQNVDFIGKTTSAEYLGPQTCRFALGVYDRRRGRLEVAPVQGERLLRMEPRVYGQQYDPREAPSAYDEQKRREHNKRLVEEFGSQRRKRQLAQAEAGQVKAEHVSAAGAILEMVAAAGEGAAGKEEVVAAALAQRNIPPHNPAATAAEEAYPVDGLVPPAVRDSLEIRRLFPACDKPDYRETLRTSGQFGSGYVLTRLELLSQKDDAAREERARMLCMLGHLLKLHARFGTLRGRSVEDMAKKAFISEGVLEPLLDMFYTREGSHEGQRYVLSKDKKALMLSYILALAVRVENSSVLEPHCLLALAEELKAKPGDLVNRFRELGCSDFSVAALNSEGAKVRSHRVALLPHSSEPKTLADSFPALKLGGKKPPGAK